MLPYPITCRRCFIHYFLHLHTFECYGVVLIVKISARYIYLSIAPDVNIYLDPNVCVCVCVCVCGHVYVVYEDTNLYNDMGMTQVLQGEGDL